MSKRKQYRTAMGRQIDMDAFVSANEEKIALGNLAGHKLTNARGDILGKGGKSIEITRQDVVQQFYREELPTPPKEASIKEDDFSGPELDISPQEAIRQVEETISKSQKSKTTKRTTKKK